MKTVNHLTHRNIWSQHSLEHHLYFHVWANICIRSVFFGFGGVFFFFKLKIYGERDHMKLTWMNRCTIPPLQDLCSLTHFFTMEAERTTFLNIYQIVGRILEQFSLACGLHICNMRITVKSDRWSYLGTTVWVTQIVRTLWKSAKEGNLCHLRIFSLLSQRKLTNMNSVYFSQRFYCTLEPTKARRRGFIVL